MKTIAMIAAEVDGDLQIWTTTNLEKSPVEVDIPRIEVALDKMMTMMMNIIAVAGKAPAAAVTMREVEPVVMEAGLVIHADTLKQQKKAGSNAEEVGSHEADMTMANMTQIVTIPLGEEVPQVVALKMMTTAVDREVPREVLREVLLVAAGEIEDAADEADMKMRMKMRAIAPQDNDTHAEDVHPRHLLPITN